MNETLKTFELYQTCDYTERTTKSYFRGRCLKKVDEYTCTRKDSAKSHFRKKHNGEFCFKLQEDRFFNVILCGDSNKYVKKEASK